MRPAHVVTGGAGFIGAHLADRLLADGEPVRILDSLARPGVERNLAWLRARHGDAVEFVRRDVRDREGVARACDRALSVYHLAAQVAVTHSLDDPLADAAINLGGTLHLLEALRRSGRAVPLVFTSTNKVYGTLDRLALRQGAGGRYAPADEAVEASGIDESMPLDFRSPYGCSKGAADQYVLDFARTLGLPAVVLRMSCIYGPRQLGTEDQGWVAHFARAALRDAGITFYGDGHQVRDLLYIDDLVAALRLAAGGAPRLAGQAFNLGGGPASARSLRELVAMLEQVLGRPIRTRRAAWRSADQRYFVADTGRFRQATGWAPRMKLAAGLAALCQWLRDAGAEPEGAAPQEALP